MPAIWKGAHPGNFRAGRAGQRPEAIVIHVMDGSLTGTDSWFNDPASKVSAHYGVGKSGAVHQYVKETDTAFHAGTVVRAEWSLYRPNSNPNYYTIGIEHEGRGLDTNPWPAAQLGASLALAADIAARWNIPIDTDHVIGHHAIRASKPDCPGRGLDLDDYIARLSQQPGAAPPEPNGARNGQAALRIVHNANLRPQPRTDGQPIRLLLAGDSFGSVGSVQGENVRGNALWYRDGDGHYIWAGVTDRPQG